MFTSNVIVLMCTVAFSRITIVLMIFMLMMMMKMMILMTELMKMDLRKFSRRTMTLPNYRNASSNCVERWEAAQWMLRFRVFASSCACDSKTPLPGACKAPEGLRPPPLPRDRLLLCHCPRICRISEAQFH